MCASSIPKHCRVRRMSSWRIEPITTNSKNALLDYVDGSVYRMNLVQSKRVPTCSSRNRASPQLILVLSILMLFPVLIFPLSSRPAEAGWWNPRELVTDGLDNIYNSIQPVVATDHFGNVHFVWVDGALDGSGPDDDIFYRKWNSTTQTWGSRVLITDDNVNNTERSYLPDVDTDIFGNVHIVWQQDGDLGGSGSDIDIFWRMWNATIGSWTPRQLITDDISGGGSRNPRLAKGLFGDMHLTLQGDSPTLDIQYRVWNGTSRTWGPKIVVFNSSVNAAGSDIAVDPIGNVHIAWEDNANISGASSNGSDSDIFHREFYVDRKEWGPISHVNEDDESDSNDSNLFGIASDFLGNVHIIWEDLGEQSGSGGDSDIFYRKRNSTDENWESRALVSSDSQNTGYSTNARICTDSMANVHVAWLDGSDVNGSGPIRLDVFYNEWDAVTGVWIGERSLTNDLLDNYNAYRPDIASDYLGNLVVVWRDNSGLLGSGSDHDIYFRRYDANLSLPDYVPVGVSPPNGTRVVTGSLNTISARVYNGGSDTPAWSTIAFYETPNPGSPFSTGSVPPLGMAERSSIYQGTWVAPSTPGTYQITIEVDYGNSISEISEQNNFHRMEFIVEEPPPPPTPPAPPTNLTTEVFDVDDILLNWTASNSTSIAYYLIYRSTDQRGFDFSAPLYNTSSDPVPLRTNWTDLDAANGTAPTEYYYVVRTVNSFEMRSITSNTAGKWTKQFDSGLSAFSLPLGPFDDKNISWYADNILNTEFIRWMDASGHWVTHDSSQNPGVDDIQANVGEGYEISLASPTTFTFCGYPASMIRFHEGLGDSIAFRKSLSAVVVGNDVNLTWQSVPGAGWYLVYKSEIRNGLHDLSLMPIANITETYWTDVGALVGRDEYYYTVIPADSAGQLGSSTYSVGVFTIAYQGGSDTFALPLKSMSSHTLDWYCENVQDVDGMAYITSEVWKFHAKEMPMGRYDPIVQISQGYQISSSLSSQFVFVGW
jgi:hypothetical protein